MLMASPGLEGMGMADYGHWQVEITEHIMTIILNVPDENGKQMNILTAQTLHELRDIAGEISANEDVWAAIIEPAGDHFSAGIDIKLLEGMVNQDEAALREKITDWRDCLDAFANLKKPTIAKIRGHCIGTGLLLALGCDIRLADETARFQCPEVQLGITAMLGTYRIVEAVGITAAKELILLTSRFTPERARIIGLITDFVTPEHLDDAVVDVAMRFRRLPPRTVAAAKRLINESASRTLTESQATELDLQVELINSADFPEALKAFFEKRKPEFTGD